MAKRPRPTKKFIYDLAGGSLRFLRDVHHGLSEVPLHKFYQILSLDETFAFAVGSWALRNKEKRGRVGFEDALQSGNVYNLFRAVNSVGFPRLNDVRGLSKGDEKYVKFNPFLGVGLRDRVFSVDLEDVKGLRRDLKQPRRVYVFESFYVGSERNFTDRGIIPSVMRFSRSNDLASSYAGELGRMLRHYPQEYQDPETFKKRIKDTQGTLFS